MCINPAGYFLMVYVNNVRPGKMTMRVQDSEGAEGFYPPEAIKLVLLSQKGDKYA